MLGLHVALVLCAAWAVQTSGWQDLRISLPLLSLLALAFGVALAKSTAPDALAHLFALVVGSLVALLLVAGASGELGGSLTSRAQHIGRLSLDWYLGRGVAGEQNALLLSMLMGTLMWLLAYLAAWTLFRRGWLFASLLLPGFLLLVNLGYAPDPERGAVMLYVLVAGILVARYHLFRRQRQWAKWGMASPAPLAARFFVTGAVVALLAVVGGWVAPQSLARAPLDPMVERFTEPLERAQRTLTGWWDGGGSGSGRGQRAEAGRFSEFGNAFSVGGPLRLTDTPAVLLQADEANYLVAHHYDAYSGRGWSSTVESTFDGQAPDGQSYSPEMTFQAGQQVPLSARVRTERAPVTGAVTLLGPRGNVVLTTDTFMMADLPTSVRLSWRRLDSERFDLSETQVGALPPDLQRITILLGRASLGPDAGGASPLPADEALRAEIEAEQGELRRRLLDVAWEAGEGGVLAALIVSGQLPVYDDVEAVYAREEIPANTPYAVTGLASSARPEQLRGAGTDYPDYVLERYLQLPAGITPRTVERAGEVRAGADNPFDAAKRIEAHLRTNIAYVEEVPVPPAGQDVVDYVLFDDPRGYCEYYASAMAVMLRTQGIPARVVVGFYPGDYDEAQDGFLYRERNAHAWVEVYFPGYGWIPFEPTASQQTRDYGEGVDEPLVESTPAETPASKLDATPPAELESVATPAATLPSLTGNEDGGGISGRWLRIGATLLATGAVVGGLFFLLWVRPLRGLSAGETLYARLLRFGRVVGLRADPTTTPLEFARSLGEAAPSARRPAMQIVHVYEVSQYGGRAADARVVEAARRSWRELRRGVLGARWRVGRWKRERDDG